MSDLLNPSNASGTSVNVNGFLWRSSLDVLSIAPLISTDALGGTIITDWYVNKNIKDKRIKITAFISTSELRSEGIKVKVHVQKLKNNIWSDTYLDKELANQIEKFKSMTKQANVPEDLVILRDRWYDKYNDFGVKLTNRAGTIETGDQEKIGKYKNCFYPTYQLLIDWNGNVYLCPQDWQRKVSMGNVMQETIFNIWTGKTLTSFRKNLLAGNRCSNPCSDCNADGTLLGKNHAKKWEQIYNKK